MTRNQEKIDPRVRRTRALLQNALLELLENKRFEKIQIKEIAGQADVSRQAFYLHFETKEELLFSIFDDVFDEILTTVFGGEEHPTRPDSPVLLETMFKLWGEHEEALRWVLQVENKDLIIARLRLHMVALMNAFGEHPEDNAQRSIGPYYEYAIDFFAGGLYMLLRRWLLEGMNISAEEMGRLTHQLVDAAGRRKRLQQ